MLNINLKDSNGIYNEVKLVDAFKVQDGLSFVLTYNGETDQGLKKIYISKFDNNRLCMINSNEWEIAKMAMSNIVRGTEGYELISIPNFLEVDEKLKPCLIASTEIFEKHYKAIEDERNASVNADESKFRFTGESNTWEESAEEEKQEELKPLEEIEENPTTSSLAEIVSKANELTKEEKSTVSSNEPEERLITSDDYKTQKTNFINLVSRSLDDILDSKNKEIVELQNTVESLERDLRKAQLERKQAVDIINLYHERIRKLNEAIRNSKEG